MATPASMSPSLPSSASRFAPRGAPCALTPPALRATAVPRGASLDRTSDNPGSRASAGSTSWKFHEALLDADTVEDCQARSTRPSLASHRGRPDGRSRAAGPPTGPNRELRRLTDGAGSDPRLAQYHLPRAKPPKAISPTKAMISPIQKLQTNISTIPTMTMMPPRDMPAIPRRSSDLATRPLLPVRFAAVAYFSNRGRPPACDRRSWRAATLATPRLRAPRRRCGTPGLL
jgi:hypothetical protein